MNKKQGSIIKISIIAVVTALLLIFSFISFDGFAGFYNASKRGLELDEGVYANYTVVREEGISDKEFAEKYDNTFLKIKNLIEQKNYQGAIVYKGTSNILRIESPDVDDASALLSEIGAGLLKIRKSNNSDDDVYLSGDDVVFAVATTSTTTGYWGTYVQFTEEAAKTLADMTKDASSNSPMYLYFYRGNSDNSFFYLPVSSAITADYLFISSSSGGMDKDAAVNLAITMVCGSMPAVVNIQGQVRDIGAVKGAMLGLEIAMGVTLLFFLLLLGLMYRELGLMAGLSLLLYVGMMMLLTQSIPLITIGVESAGAILLNLILISVFNIIILERVKEDFKVGKKLNIAVKSGYKKSINLIADASGALLVISLIGFLISKGMLKSFMMLLLTGTIISCIISLFVSYQLFISYTEFNKNDGKKVNFVREEEINESK